VNDGSAFASQARFGLVERVIHTVDHPGTLVVLLDVDEHTGNFSGAKALLQTIDTSIIAGVLISYPGHDEVTIGGRGVFRARLHVHGIADHSGASKTNPVNAAIRAAQLVTLLDDFPLSRNSTPTTP
jgi:succinyl-diaminopimelate desuccinylase